MLINWHTLLILIIMAVSTITATKCGKYECYDNTECTFDEDKKEMKCICEKDFTTTLDENNVYCCQKENTKCGPNHQCNKELQCKDLTEEIVMPMKSETLECGNREQKCEDKCCATDEICHEGRECVAKGVKNENCPIARQCAEKCCKANESCSSDKECIENLSLSEADAVTSEEANVSCPADRQCAKKCCKANESCSKDEECIEKELCQPEKQCNGTCCNHEEICSENKICIDQSNICPEAQQCFGKCCSEQQICTEDKECLDEWLAICSKEKRCNNKICCNRDELCWENLGCGDRTYCDDSKICLGKCCHANETCNERFECIFQENPITLDCPLKQQCNGKCCAINEICSESKMCIDPDTCPEAQKCFGKCCSEEQICTLDKGCLDVWLARCSEEKRCNNKLCCNRDELCWENLGCINRTYCGVSKICLGKCCHANETCNERFECIFQENPITLDCPLEQQCKGKCCADNEICSESECYEGNLNNNLNMPECPKQQQCGEICCEANDICSDEFKCLKRKCLKCGGFCCTDKEICSENLECKPITSVDTNCPITQQCYGKCCPQHETCHVYECVNKMLLNHLGLYDFPKEKPNNDFNAVLELYDFENSNPIQTQCPANHATCRELCCQPHQFCNSLGQCEENPVATSDDDVELPASLGYHSIGICCLVFAIGFSLFKIISACIGSQQYVLK